MEQPGTPSPPNATVTPPDAPVRFDLRPLLLSNCLTTMTMLAFMALIGPIARALSLTAWQAGAVITVGGVLWMLMAPVWGRISDAHGRRAVLLIGLGGFAVCYALMCALLIFALRVPIAPSLAFAGLLLTRGTMGAFYAAVPAVAQALVADNVAAHRRTSAMAALGAANAVGLVIGPALAAALTAIDLAAPLYLLAVVPLVPWAALWFVLPKYSVASRAQSASVKLVDPRLRRPMVVAFTALFGVTISQVVVGFFAIDRLGLAPEAAARVSGMALTGVGFALILSQLVVRRLSWPPARLIRWGAVLGAIGFTGMAAAVTPAMLVAAYFVTAAGMGWVFPAFAAMAANSVGPSEQGAAAGAVGAAQGLGTVMGPLIGTLLYETDPGAPYLLVAVMMAALAVWRLPPAPRP